MSKLNTILKSEIARISKRELKPNVSSLTRKVAELRRMIQQQKKEIKSLAAKIAVCAKHAGKGGIVPNVSDDVLKKSRLSGKMITRMRNRLKLSRAALAKVLGVNQNSIYFWEVGRSSPRADMRAKIIQLRKTGKRQIKKLLGGIKCRVRKPKAASQAPAQAQSSENKSV